MKKNDCFKLIGALFIGIVLTTIVQLMHPNESFSLPFQIISVLLFTSTFSIAYRFMENRSKNKTETIKKNTTFDPSHCIASISVNDIDVGSLPATQYFTITDSVYRKYSLWILQGFNLLGVLLRFLSLTIRYVPYFWFLLMTLITLYDPATITAFIATIRIATSADITEAIKQALFLGVFGSGLSHFLVAVTGLSNNRFGYENQFNLAISKRLRELLEVPTEGKLSVTVKSINHGNE